jgi:hypothetical protein
MHVIVFTGFISSGWLTGNLSIRAKKDEHDTIIESVPEDSPGSDISKEKRLLTSCLPMMS